MRKRQSLINRNTNINRLHKTSTAATEFQRIRVVIAL